MDDQLTATARKCLDAAYAGTMDFPSIVRQLMDAGFEGYDVDYRRGTSTYFRANGDHVELALPASHTNIAAAFDAHAVEQAVRDAQNQVPGYTYLGFSARVRSAGCAGYMVSFSGRRVVYFGRTAETHVEHFPR
ncbi:MAG: DUF1398 family protein [Gemmatimonadaceae bacterium]|nr:DUF1398 family protein [Gemmatimonadaceae bacterium]